MRRSLALVSCLLLSLALVVVPGVSASAVEPPPPPVQPVGSLPSTYAKSAFTGSGLADDQVRFAAWVLQQAKAAQAGTATGAAVAAGVPITQSAALTATSTGGVLTAAFTAGWMITDGTLAMYANATGTNPLGGSCSWGDFGAAAVEILYPFSSPDCRPTIANPNDGVTPGPAPLTYAGFSATYKGLIPGSSGTYCYTISGSLSTAYAIFSKRYSDGTYMSRGQSMANPGAYCNPVGGANGYVSTAEGATGTPSGSAWIEPYFQIRVVATGQVVASMANLSANPNRVPKCDLTWPDGSHTSQTGLPYQETDGIPMAQFDALCNDAFVSKPGHGPALLPSRIKIGSTNEETGAFTEIQDAPVPDFSPSEEKGLTPGTTGGGLVLQRVIGTTVSSCMTWDVDCAGWWEESEEGTSSTSEYRCLYNGSAVDLVECGVYRHTFDTKTSTPRITDPQTGEESEWMPAPNRPDGSPNTTNPGTGIGTPGGDCMASWPAAADPISWVLHPVKCALVWAFVPRASVVQASQNALTEEWETTPMHTTTAALASLGAAFDAGDGCEGLPFHLEGFGVVLVHAQLLESCTEPAAGTAAVVKTVLTVVIIGGALLALLRYLGAVFGYAAFGRNNSEKSGGPSFS